ncbi:hypothetical protein FRC02_012462 [Tulasnella sp. 418]|nr:hypothetical protein FRC02_012462 [Tulasnella sp. 418]
MITRFTGAPLQPGFQNTNQAQHVLPPFGQPQSKPALTSLIPPPNGLYQAMQPSKILM